MAYYRDGNLVTQGDAELRTIASCVGLVGEVAPFIFEDPDKVEKLRTVCNYFIGRTAMTFMLTPGDPEDSALAPIDPGVSKIFDILQQAIPEFGLTEHEYQGIEAEFIVNALEFRVATAPCDEREERDQAQAMLMLEQLNNPSSH